MAILGSVVTAPVCIFGLFLTMAKMKKGKSRAGKCLMAKFRRQYPTCHHRCWRVKLQCLSIKLKSSEAFVKRLRRLQAKRRRMALEGGPYGGFWDYKYTKQHRANMDTWMYTL